MKKVKLTDLDGKEIEVYFADDKSVPSNKDWVEMTGGKLGQAPSSDYSDPDHPLNKHDEGQMYWFSGDEKYPFAPLNEQDVNEGSAGEGAHESFYEKLNKQWVNKIKGLEESQSQISIDDTIPTDFVDTSDLRGGSIYKVAGLGLTAKFVSEWIIPQFGGPALTTPENKILLQMKRHGTIL